MKTNSFDCTAQCETPLDESIKIRMPDENLLYDMADFFKIYSDSTRIKILWALSVSEMCVCNLAELLNMTKSAISHQLKTLRQAKAVKCRKDGKNVYYSLQDEHIKDIFNKAYEHISGC